MQPSSRWINLLTPGPVGWASAIKNGGFSPIFDCIVPAVTIFSSDLRAAWGIVDTTYETFFEFLSNAPVIGEWAKKKVQIEPFEEKIGCLQQQQQQQN